MPEEMRTAIANIIASTYPNDWKPVGLGERVFKVEYLLLELIL